MDPNNYRNHRGSMQGYPLGYPQYVPSDRRSSFPASQTPQLGWQLQPYSSQTGGQDVTNQYEYSPGTNWSNNVELAQANIPESVPASDFDPSDLQRWSSSANEDPWTGARPNHGFRPHTSPHLCVPNLNVPKAHTVAAHPRFEGFKKPPFKPRPSFTSSVDSGFVSGPTLSENLPEAPELNSQNISQLQSGYHSAFNEANGPPGSVRSDPHPEGFHVGTKRRRSKAQVPPCSECGKELKNHSDAQKHEYQHTKPFLCAQPGCQRAQRREGFATRNDLERHKKSVHRADPLVGKKSGYICYACPRPSPGTKEKWWPRLDNFKAHIQRKHKDWQMQSLIDQSERAKPDDAVSDQGYASQPPLSHPPEDQRYQQEFSSPIAPGMSRHASHQGDFATLFEFEGSRLDQLAGVGAVADHFAGRRQSDSRFHGPRPTTGNSLAVLHDAALQQLSSPTDSMMGSPTYARHSMPEVFINGSTWTDGHQQRFGQLQLEDRSPKRQKLVGPMIFQEGANDRNATGEHVCDQCGKAKKRECDLRKHMKRHTRPYGCTFPGCSKRFGSRNDWKRHENSQHFLQEMWRCEKKRQDGTKCGKLVHNEDIFAHHLERKHGIPIKSDQSETDCKSMHLGREGHHHFWCGFCDGLIKQPNNGQQGAWDVRFKHIGDHFDKENKHIENWIDVEENKKKGLITERDRKKKKLRYRNGRFDDDSDLGEDGIPSFVPEYNTAPVSHSPAGKSAATGGYTFNKKRMDIGDADADAVSDDDEWRV